jgi:hypothetical protein
MFQSGKSWLIFDTPFFAYFRHIQKYAPDFKHYYLREFLSEIQL